MQLAVSPGFVSSFLMFKLNREELPPWRLCQNSDTYIVHRALSLPGVVQKSLEHSGGHSTRVKTNWNDACIVKFCCHGVLTSWPMGKAQKGLNLANSDAYYVTN